MGKNKEKIILVIFLVIISMRFAVSSHAAGAHHEKYYQDKWCSEHGGVTEYVLPDGARVDCLTDTMAVEFDWAKKWAEGYGQARYYAAITGKRGVVVLIVGPRDGRFVRRLEVAAGDEVEIRTMEKVL